MVLKLISYFTENMLYIHYKHKVSETLRGFIILQESYKTHEDILQTKCSLLLKNRWNIP